MNQKLKILVLLLILGSHAAFGQSKSITGTVTDDQGQTMPGVTVILVGTSQGTVTDIDGNYQILAEPGSELKFSFIGYREQIIKLGTQSVIDVNMAPDTEAIEEVVIVGYGTQKKETVVGAITQTTSDELKKQGNVTNISDALTGAMPGVIVMTQTGVPGGGGDGEYNATDILIRGKSTWNNSSPLILVDGIERDMNEIDINEVENVSVLKDASATAVFGMKGGNGVILITTKRGKAGKPKLTFEANKTFENISKYPEILGSYEGIVARNRAIINEATVNPISWGDFVPDSELAYYQSGELPYAFADNNWSDQMLKDFASSHRFNMNVSGGTKFVKYFGSLSYNHTGDILSTEDVGQGYNPEFSYDRFNFRTNLDFSITKTTEFTANISGYYGVQHKSGGNYHNLWYGLYRHAPDWPIVQYEDGVYGDSQEIYERVGFNEYVGIMFSGYSRANKTEVNSDFALKQDLDFVTKGLKFKAKLAYDNYFATNGPNISDDGVLTKTIDKNFYLDGGYYNEQTGQYEMDGQAVDMVGEGYVLYEYPDGGTDGFEWVEAPLGYGTEGVNAGASQRKTYYEASLNYARKFGVHDVTALALFSRQKSESGSGWPRKREDWVSRVTYNYDSRYFAEVNAAYNGSEKFGPGYKYDFFPSFAVGWTLSNEQFMKNSLPFINLLKVKYSNGYVGNDNVSGGQWGYLTVWNASKFWSNGTANAQPFGYNLIPSYAKYSEGTPGNPDLRWEKSHKQNLGFEVELFDGLISGSADIFNEYRYDMLVAAGQRTVPVIFGQTPPAANIGEVKSNGAEIEGSVFKKFSNGLSVKVGGSWTYSRNEILYKEDAALKPFYQKQAGYAIGQNRATIEQGFIQSWDDIYTGVNDDDNNQDLLPGDFRYIDYNSNGMIDPDDGAPFGYPIYPLNTYSGNLNVSYKGWSLSALLYGTYNVTRTVGLDLFSFDSPIMYGSVLEDTWTPEYDVTNPTFPHLGYKKGNSGSGTYFQYDGAILRLKSVELSYTLPKKWSKAINASKVRLYANGNNLFVWTDMPADGEGANFELKNYPVKKNMTFGVNIQF